MSCCFEYTHAQMCSQCEAIDTTKMEASERRNSAVGSERKENAVPADSLGSDRAHQREPERRN